jgi:aspartyl-tRNA(Asn)/glutamyl-tRNA(Gln) amidotransferase subunit A
MKGLRFLPALDAIALMEERKLSARDYVGALLAAIAAGNDRLGAFIDVYGDEALKAAQQADDLRAKNANVPPLTGLPFAVKDLIDVEGRPTTAQSKASLRQARRDSAVVRKLRGAGAILLGKLALEEWGFGSPLDDLPLPPVRNPWDLSRTPGGSSSGAGVALAAGLVPLAVGTDTGGSVRNPAALCGVVGLKPTYGRISRAGVIPLARTLDHVGPMARTVADCRLLFDILTGEPNAQRGIGRQSPLTGRTIGHLAHFYQDDIEASAEMCAAIAEACRVLEQLGAKLVDVRVSSLAQFRACGDTILRAEAHAFHRLRLARAPEDFGARCRQALLEGGTIDAASYVEARAARRRLASEIDHLFETCDLLLTAVTSEPACLFDDQIALDRSGRGALRIPFNVTRHPALSLPVGFSAEHLPLAMQLIGPRGADEMLLDMAMAYQDVTPWHNRHPDVDQAVDFLVPSLPGRR